MENAIYRFLICLEEEQDCAENTIIAYQSDLQQLLHVLSASEARPIAPGSIRPESIAKYVTWLLQQGYQPATVSRKMAAVRSFLSYIDIHEGKIDTRLINELHSPPSPKRQSLVLSREDAAALLIAPARFNNPRALRDRAILEFIYAVGFRAADVVSLRLKDVNLARNIVYRSSYRDQPIPLSAAADSMRQYLQDGRPHLARNPQVRAFFLNQRGQCLTRQGLWLVVKRWAAVAGLGKNISPHTLRHTLIRNLLEEGKTRQEVQQFLGLSSPNAISFHFLISR